MSNIQLAPSKCFHKVMKEVEVIRRLLVFDRRASFPLVLMYSRSDGVCIRTLILLVLRQKH